jgi:hypothetical protein
MSCWEPYIADIVFSFRKYKDLAEKAVVQVPGDGFFRQPGEHSNSIALIIKHLAGNLRSRWTDFLTTDGDKPWRDRDSEFVLGPEDTRAQLLSQWEAGWTALFRTLESLQECDWQKIVKIRQEEHSVLQAIHRALTHTAYHVGQIVYLCRLLTTGDWQWLTIPPGHSESVQVGHYLK